MIDFERARTTMVDNQLRPADITDRQLLAAMGRIPRELFVPETRAAIAYTDTDHPIGTSGRSLPSPATFAQLAQLAKITPEDFVLDVGCGAGYSTAVLAALAGSVVGLEEDQALVDIATANLAKLEVGNSTAVAADVQKGLPEEAPFDVILLEGAIQEVPDALLGQLREGGRLVAMIGQGATATAHLFVRSGDDITARPSFNAVLPPLVTQTASPQFSF